MPSLIGHGRAAIKFRRRRQYEHRLSAEMRQSLYAKMGLVKAGSVDLSNYYRSPAGQQEERGMWDVQTDLVGISRPEPRYQHGGRPSDLEQECADLKVRNEELTEELRSLRSLMAKRFASGEQPDRGDLQWSVESHNK